MTEDHPLSRYVAPLRRWWPIVLGTVVLGLVVALVTLPEPPEPGQPTPVDPSVNYTATQLLQRERSTADTSSFDLVLLLARQGELAAMVEAELGDAVAPGAVSSVQLEPNKDLGTIGVSATQPTEDQATLLVETYARSFVEFFDARAQEAAAAEYEAKLQQVSAFGERIQLLQQQAESLPEGAVDRRLLEAEIDVLIEQYGLLQAEAQSLNLQAVANEPTFRTIQEAFATPVVVGGGTLSIEVPETPWARFALAAAVALVLGVLIVLGLDWLDTRIRNRADAELAFGLPVLGELPRENARKLRLDPLMVVADPSSGPSEVFRSVRLSLALAPRWKLDGVAPTSDGSVGSAQRLTGQGQPRTIVVTSARDGEGKSTVVANLAASFAETGQRVLVVDCDFRRSTVGDLLQAAGGPGLRDIELPDRATIAGLVRDTIVNDVALIRSGEPGVAPAWFLAESYILVDACQDLADIVIFDTGPVLSTNEASSLIASTDVSLVVCRSGRLSRSQATHATEHLARLQATVAGVMLVGAESSHRHGYYYEPIRQASAKERERDAWTAARNRPA